MYIIQEMSDKKAVLVSFKERNRVVHFSGSDLLPAVREVFSDVLDETVQLVLQLKDESWGGVFIDLQDRLDLVQDRSVLRIIVDKCQKMEVCTHTCIKVICKNVFYRGINVKKYHQSSPILWSVRMLCKVKTAQMLHNRLCYLHPRPVFLHK